MTKDRCLARMIEKSRSDGLDFVDDTTGIVIDHQPGGMMALCGVALCVSKSSVVRQGSGNYTVPTDSENLCSTIAKCRIPEDL
jgi:hypothetical protein